MRLVLSSGIFMKIASTSRFPIKKSETDFLGKNK